MPRFPAFVKRKSTADSLENVTVTGPSFRVLERTEVSGVKSFDGGVRLTGKPHAMHRSTASEITVDDNIFADLKSNRGSGSSNTTKTNSTDNSSRHSNASTAPSSADMGGQEDWRNSKKLHADIPVPPIPKSSSANFLKAAGRTFSFGGQKKPLPPAPEMQEERPSSPVASEVPTAQTPVNGRSRATTTSTATTVTPPRIDNDFSLDLGGDFGKMILGSDKRASLATLKDEQKGRQALAPRSLTASRLNQPSPLQIDMTTKVEASPYSWNSQHSNDQLIAPSSPSLPNTENQPPPMPRHGSPLAERKPSASPEAGPRKPLLAPKTPTPEEVDGDDEEARLLRDSLSTVNKFMTGSVTTSHGPSTSRYRRDEDDDSLFDTTHSYSAKSAGRFTAKKASPHVSNKVMTPAEFEKYRQDKERQDKERQQETVSSKGKDDDDEDNYEDDEDDLERAKQQTKQRRKQEAHMAVYRQQMMKVTGESANLHSSRPSLQISFSTPNLPNLASGASPAMANSSDPSDEDEEVPLAILAAHGFPNRNRPPTRLSTMGSNPNLRASQQPSFQRPVSVVGDAAGAGAGTSGRLPAFARNLPQDPFLGAGLVRNSVRESFALGGGAPAPGNPTGAIPPGGLINIIANEERNRAMRRGSPHIDGSASMPVMPGAATFDPMTGMPSHLGYQNPPNPPMLTPGDQAQIQMTQQMQTFMQMQMQFMQMMAGQNGSAPPTPNGYLTASQSTGSLAAMGGMPGVGALPPMPGMGGPPEMRRSFLGNDSMLDLPTGRGGEAQMRTMSMVQPSSASWIQPMQHAGFAPSVMMQGGGYAPSIAPSERSNIGLPGRYRPVSHVPAPHAPVAPGHLRKSTTMSGAIAQPTISVTKSGSGSDDDDEEGWAAMKAKREKKQSLWKSRKSSIGGDLGAFIS
ncbi:hypothetical protein B0T21DRAFT_170617 [Apiosordaria backusii]|uniref:Uncharacterized protein n=1 Tax=Apiosordaria backusii TaxID=314023 RepID=A0AA40BNX1_9PEZI|nr:hypothetical protein B0T21DRAFT_170617 [Apiosordaria backusii]